MEKKKIGAVSALVAVVWLAAVPVAAKPVMEPLGENIADSGSAYYRFHNQTFHSRDGQRHYKVWIAIPNKAPPSEGYPVLYLLDGNAAMARLTESRLREMAAASPPVLVAVGYDTPLPFDIKARTQDYTPPAANNLAAVDQPIRPGGGSHAFRALLLDHIVPWAEQWATSNPDQRAIWGHSFAGLFVLDTLNTSSWFTDYFAAAPSLGWENQRIVSLLTTSTSQLTGKTLYLMEGDGKTDQRKGFSAEGGDEVLLNAVKQRGGKVQRVHYPGLNHGEMFPSSLADALNGIAHKR